ncbi:Do family serine endopeptidase [Hyphomicrobium sp. CS1GBMeth3]|uniref:Do family serine endopeptidase n=1 Tax=Hyphomicrobium sp. CS1GBMeth3 TaxID=1892845 RepID=UPI0009FB1D1D|nr:Do family serine endopeptidase [Hyphomicrobium sp. CS1GBMeth3]
MLTRDDRTSGAKSGPTSQGTSGRRVARATIVAVASAAVLAGGVAITPTLAQLAPDKPGVETPFGRAPLSFADVIEKVKPSVVSISVVAGSKGRTGPSGLPEGFPEIPEDSPFYEFFKNLPKEFRNMPQQRPTQAQGSGFVISADGYVVTNNHVIEGATKIQVSFDDQEKLEADLVGSDPRTDIALLKLKSSKTFPFVKFSDKPVRVGDWALAVGNPFGLGGTVTAGIVSALGRDIGSGPYDFLQIDAAVNKGNSGGPTFNLEGEAIGVNTAIFSPSGGNVGIAFAVPARTAIEVIEQLKKTGSVSRGWLGVKIQNVDEDTAAAIGLTNAKGALVSEITPNGPASSSGLKVQDAIVQVNGDKINDSRDLARKIAEYAPDTTVDVKVWRGNKEETVKVKLGKFPGSTDELAKLEQGKSVDPASTALEQLGLTLAPAKAGGEGVSVTEVDPSSDAAEKGIKAGDVILEIGGDVVSGPSDVAEGIKKAKDLGRRAVMLSIKSSNQTRYVPVQLKQG